MEKPLKQTCLQVIQMRMLAYELHTTIKKQIIFG
jgi:hypothetical protein